MASALGWLSVAICVQAAEFAYITNQGEHTVSVVDLQQHTVLSTVAVGKAPVGVAVDHHQHKVYVSNVEGRSLSVIEMSSQQVMRTMALPIAPVGPEICPVWMR